MTAFFVKLPKIELHAHLNACLSEDTVKALISQTKDFGIPQAETFIEHGTSRTFKDSFDMFKAVTFATKAVISEFAADGVSYLELRSTPRSNDSTGMTKRLYIEAVLQGIEEYLAENVGLIEVGYLPSIDRRLGIEEAENTVNLAIEYKNISHGRVVGIDFSGDATVGDAREYLHIFKRAKDSGLKLAIHMGEVRGLDQESLALLSLPPDRIGHGTFLHENPKCVDIITEQRIPLEVCLTSNVKCETVISTSKEHHHMYKWRRMGHPVVICTDGKGAFDITISGEYEIATKESGMTHEKVFVFSKSAIDHIFANDIVKTMLRGKWDQWKKKHSYYFSES